MDNNINKQDSDQEIKTTSLHNLCFFIIIVLLCVILCFTCKTYLLVRDPVYVGTLEHYDSLYENREFHISMDQSGNITGYNAPDGTHYTFKTPISPTEFHNK